MKKTLFACGILTASLMMTSSAHAYKFVIYTDEAVTNKSEQVADLMKNTYPFNKFKIDVEIVRVPHTELNCDSSEGIERLVACDNTEELQALAARRGGDQAMVVKNLPKWGGSSGVGGGVPVITTGTSARAMLHEFLHTLGMCDEYEYKPEEAMTYCGRDTAQPNVVFIVPRESYLDDMDARNAHGGKIPWFGDIFPTTPITNAGGIALGTGPVNFDDVAPVNNTNSVQRLGGQIGLYRGKVCNKAIPPKVSWHPGGGATIMENTEAGLGAPLERIVERIMISKGAQKKITANVFEEAEVVVPPVREGQRPPKVTKTEDPKPDYEINDSGRNFFKSFFQWIQNIFRSWFGGISR